MIGKVDNFFSFKQQGYLLKVHTKFTVTGSSKFFSIKPLISVRPVQSKTFQNILVAVV